MGIPALPPPHQSSFHHPSDHPSRTHSLGLSLHRPTLRVEGHSIIHDINRLDDFHSKVNRIQRPRHNPSYPIDPRTRRHSVQLPPNATNRYSPSNSAGCSIQETCVHSLTLDATGYRRMLPESIAGPNVSLRTTRWGGSDSPCSSTTEDFHPCMLQVFTTAKPWRNSNANTMNLNRTRLPCLLPPTPPNR